MSVPPIWRVSIWSGDVSDCIIPSVTSQLQKQFISLAKAGGIFTLHSLNQLLWPGVCANCRQSISEMDKGLCESCWSELLACTGADYCPRCGKDAGGFAMVEGVCPDCQGRQIYFDGIARAGVYDRSLRQMILSFKNGRAELDSVLSFLAESALEGCDFHNQVEFFVPVPLHWSRRLVRGYNQSHVLLGRLKPSGARISTDLVRIRRTKIQPAMASPTARARNVAGAFAVRRRHGFAGRRICIVDDIKTTGATLNECARVLKAAGASKVFALVLAVAGQNIG